MDLDIRDLYQRLFKVANLFLNMTMCLSIAELKCHDPSVEEIARLATLLSKIMNQLVDNDYSDERISINAAQAAHLMRQIAIAVRKDDQELLNRSVGELEKLDFV
jgi:hypothetical protein